MISLFGGIIALILGIIFIIIWFGFFVKGLMAVLPAMFILGGALATYLGIEELKEKSSSDSFEEDKEELKTEVESLKEEIKELKEEPPSSDEEKKE